MNHVPVNARSLPGYVGAKHRNEKADAVLIDDTIEIGHGSAIEDQLLHYSSRPWTRN